MLIVDDLSLSFKTPHGWRQALSHLSFDVKAGQSVALVGESGSGKSITALTIMRLLAMPPARIDGGRICLDGRNIYDLANQDLKKIRGKKMSMIFQEPMTSLNPVYCVGRQISEVLKIHRGLNDRVARNQSIELMERVRIPSAEQRYKEYPHQMSGGMRQRIMIAIAIACKPGLLIADEPTTALDVTIQIQVLDLLKELKKDLNMGLLLITHDLGVVAHYCDDVNVLYGGEIVEKGPTQSVLLRSFHPYTQALLKCIPHLKGEQDRIPVIAGSVPSVGEFPQGCKFRNRCEFSFDKCKDHPELLPPYADDLSHLSACWLNKKDAHA